MNPSRRSLLRGFLALPVAARLAVFEKPAPYYVVDRVIHVPPGGNLQAAMTYAAYLGGAIVYLEPGHHEFLHA